MSKRRVREQYSSSSSVESSPNYKNLKMAEQEAESHVDDEAPTLSSIYELIQKVQRNTDELIQKIQRNTDAIREEGNEFRKEILQIKSEAAKQAKTIERLEKENKRLDEQVQRFEYCVVDLKSKLNQQQEEIDDISQYQRKYNLEIQGIPEREDEDLNDIIEELANELRVEIDRTDIDIVHRQRSKITPRPVLVKFKSYGDKHAMYKARRRLKNYEGNAGKINGAKRIFINEHLTAERKKLFAEVRQKAKQYHWYSVATNDGKIFIKTSKEERPIMVTKQADLEDVYRR